MSLVKSPRMTEKKVAANARNRKLAHGPARDRQGQQGHATSASRLRERDAPAPAGGGTRPLQNAVTLHYVLEIKWVSHGQRKSCKNLYS
jgi:hypothetical protein